MWNTTARYKVLSDRVLDVDIIRASLRGAGSSFAGH